MCLFVDKHMCDIIYTILAHMPTKVVLYWIPQIKQQIEENKKYARKK